MPSSVLAVFDEREDAGVQTCTTCPRLCRWACPVAEAEARESTSPHSLVVLSGLVKHEKASVASAGALAYHCTFCGACTEACLHRNDVPLLLSLARSRIFSAGAAPKLVREICGHFGVAGNPQGESLEPALSEIVESVGGTFARDAKTVYVPGCETIAALPEAAASVLRSLTLLGLSEVGVVPAAAACCGLPLFWAGEIEGFKAHATRYAAQFSKMERLVVHDAACAHALAVRYPELGVPLRPAVVHVAKYLADNVDLRIDRERTVDSHSFAYADACSLSRGLGLVEEPRRLLEVITGRRPIELAGPSKLEVDCCGASGLLPQVAPQTARLMAEARIEAFKESGADELLMLSPRCAAHLRSIDPSIPVADASSVIARV